MKIFMKWAVEMYSGGVINIPSFMAIGSGIQVNLRLLPQQFERLQRWYYWWEGFIFDDLRWYYRHTKFHEDRFRRSEVVRGDGHTYIPWRVFGSRCVANDHIRHTTLSLRLFVPNSLTVPHLFEGFPSFLWLALLFLRWLLSNHYIHTYIHTAKVIS
jgi:hypothetical protein